MSSRLRTVALAAVALGLALVTTLALARSATGPSGDPAIRLAAELSCPSCQGESVANSDSPVAASMRTAIAEQLAAGRSPAEIRAWFVERYGPTILMDPPKRGAGLALWVVPAAVCLLASLLAIRRVRPKPAAPRGTADDSGTLNSGAPGGGTPDGDGTPDRDDRSPRRRGSRYTPRGIGYAFAAGLAIMVSTVAFLAPRPGAGPGQSQPASAPKTSPISPGPTETNPTSSNPTSTNPTSTNPTSTNPTSTGDPVAAALASGVSLERQNRFAEAADLYRSALSTLNALNPPTALSTSSAQPSSAGSSPTRQNSAQPAAEQQLRIRLGYALLRADRPAEAADTASTALGADPDSADALLVLGLAQRAMQSPAATETLRRFLRDAPNHPAADQVRRLVQ